MTAAKALPADLIDSLLSGYKKPEDLIGESENGPRNHKKSQEINGVRLD